MSASTPRTIDEYLAGVRDDQRVALEKVRKAIKAAAPQAEECFGYGMPAFRLGHRLIAGFAATRQFGSYYPMSGWVISGLAAELADFETTKGAIHFTKDRPLTAALVRKLVKARLAEDR